MIPYSFIGAEVVSPAEEDVESGVQYGLGGTEFTGTLTGGGVGLTAQEIEQLRYRLGIDGTATAPTTNKPNLGAIGAILETTVATIAIDNSFFTIDEGPTNNSALLGAWIVLKRGSTLLSLGRVASYVGATRTVTPDRWDGKFSLTTGDKVIFYVNRDEFSAQEMAQLRYRVGLDGTATEPATNQPNLGSAQESTLLLVKVKTDLLTGAAVNLVSPVAATGDISPIILGDDYLSANGRAFQWTVPLPAGVTIASGSCKFGGKCRKDATKTWLVTGTLTDAGSGNVTLTFELPSSTFNNLIAGDYDWSVAIISDDSKSLTQVYGQNSNHVQLIEKQT